MIKDIAEEMLPSRLALEVAIQCGSTVPNGAVVYTDSRGGCRSSGHRNPQAAIRHGDHICLSKAVTRKWLKSQKEMESIMHPCTVRVLSSCCPQLLFRTG